MFNRITLVGRLTRDPELRYTPQGTPVTNLRLAVSERYRDRNGEVQEETLFIDVTVWGAQAATVERYLRKGRLVLVDGRLRMETWKDRDGNNRTTYRVVARQVRFLDGAAEAARVEREEAPPPEGPPVYDDLGSLPETGPTEDIPF